MGGRDEHPHRVAVSPPRIHSRAYNLGLIRSEAVATLPTDSYWFLPVSVHPLSIMPTFDPDNFTTRLLAESLFYDLEYGLVGSVSLIDAEAGRELYLASFMPDDGSYLVEEATAWEDTPELEEDTDVAYALATDSDVHGRYEVPEAAAQSLMELAREHDLLPSVTVLFEDEEL